MKLATAQRYAREIHERLRAVNGLLATPLCENEAVRFSRVWVFGSTVKGSQTPNDLDLLIECRPVGRHRTLNQAPNDLRYLRQYGMPSLYSSKAHAFKWLTKGMKLVSRHDTDWEIAPLPERVLIYPRFDLAQKIKPPGE